MIPIYKIVINDEETGIDRISLVKYPAVESNFLAFEKNEKKLTFKADEEQKIIMGVLARADYPIYRYDTQIGEYYIQFSKEVIKELAENYHASFYGPDESYVTGLAPENWKAEKGLKKMLSKNPIYLSARESFLKAHKEYIKTNTSFRNSEQDRRENFEKKNG